MKRILVWGMVLGVVAAGISAATRLLPVFDRPGGTEVGRWSGEIEVLAVDGDWALVKMTGWAPAAEVAPDAPGGQRISGSPGGGLWIRDVTTRAGWSWGTVPDELHVMGQIVNATGRNFTSLYIDIVLLDRDGRILRVTTNPIHTELPSGTEKAVSLYTLVTARDVHAWELQYNAGYE